MSLDSISLATQILCLSIVPPLIALRAFAKYKSHLPFGVDDGMSPFECSAFLC